MGKGKGAGREMTEKRMEPHLVRYVSLADVATVVERIPYQFSLSFCEMSSSANVIAACGVSDPFESANSVSFS